MTGLSVHVTIFFIAVTTVIQKPVSQKIPVSTSSSLS